MGHHQRNQTMSAIASALVVVLLVLEAPAFSSARFMDEKLPSVTSRRGLSESKPGSLAMGLMHAQHVDSPYRQPNLTSLQRAEDAVKSSRQRLRYFNSKVSRKRTTLGVQRDAFTSPVYSSMSFYTTTIEVGTPARTFFFFVDTGSDLIWLQCTPCSPCLHHPDALFDPTASSSYTDISCSANLCLDLPKFTCSLSETCLYDYRYADQAFTQGSLAYETFTLQSTDGTATAFSNVGFGCGTDQSGGDTGTYDGLVGLGGGPLSLVSQLGAYLNGVFSYCLVGYYAATTQTSSLLLGSLGDSVYFYTPLLSNPFNPTGYYINLLGISVAGTPVDYPPGTFALDTTTGDGGMILDSGTTLTLLFDAAYVPFVNAISVLISYPRVDKSSSGLDLCYDTSGVSSPVFPDVVLEFDSVVLTLKVPNTFLEIDNEGTYCLYFKSTGGITGSSVFGNVQQQNIAIGYDLLNGQVGFAGQAC